MNACVTVLLLLLLILIILIKFIAGSIIVRVLNTTLLLLIVIFHGPIRSICKFLNGFTGACLDDKYPCPLPWCLYMVQLLGHT